MINIIGSGLAGLSAAISLSKRGITSNLISVQEAQRAQSVMAEGGINAALNVMGEDDDFMNHYEDTMKGGAYLADPNAVYGLCKSAPEIVQWLLELGVPFEMKDGKLIQRNFGGQKKKRTAYIKSSTGKMLMSALIDEVRKYEVQGLVKRYSHHKALDVIVEDGACKGVIIKDEYSDETKALAGPVILASGGLTGLFIRRTTGSSDNTGQLVSNLFLKGLEMANLEMIQYHPTTINIGEKRLLVSEAARGEGGRLMTYKNGKPYYFMEELYPAEKNLTTRDVATRAIYRIMNDKEYSGDVYLDMTHIDPKIIEERLSDMREELLDYFSIDLCEKPFKVEPGIHYFMGGVYVDEDHRTNIKDLYAAGECACQYHGANRLGGNSLLGAIYGGKVAAENIEDTQIELKETGSDQDQCSPLFDEKLAEILCEGLGIIRNEAQMNKALRNCEELKKEALNKAEANKLTLAEAMLRSALERKESRGGHYREDYPETDEAYRKSIVASYDQGIKIKTEEIPERRAQ